MLELNSNTQEQIFRDQYKLLEIKIDETIIIALRKIKQAEQAEKAEKAEAPVGGSLFYYNKYMKYKSKYLQIK